MKTLKGIAQIDNGLIARRAEDRWFMQRELERARLRRHFAEEAGEHGIGQAQVMPPEVSPSAVSTPRGSTLEITVDGQPVSLDVAKSALESQAAEETATIYDGLDSIGEILAVGSLHAQFNCPDPVKRHLMRNPVYRAYERAAHELQLRNLNR